MHSERCCTRVYSSYILLCTLGAPGLSPRTVKIDVACAVIASIRLPTHTTCSVGVRDNISSRGCDGFDRSTGRLQDFTSGVDVFFEPTWTPIRRVVMTVEAYGRGLWCSEPLRHDHPSSLCRPLPTWSHLWVLPVPPTGKIYHY